jgi:prepilin-type N-terminal cleavage/methylation domain-containing protein
MRNIRNSKGFTLIELMIVVVIIGILAAIAIPKFGAASDRAKEKEADGILKQVYTLQSAYTAQHGVAATTVAELLTVGFQAPTNTELKHYTWADNASVVVGACLAAKTATGTGTPSHSGRSINANGVIANC